MNHSRSATLSNRPPCGGFQKGSLFPEELVSHDVPAHLERVATAQGSDEWIAHLSDTFAAVVPGWEGGAGSATLTGYLQWDRYLWLFHPTPHARARIIDRANLTQATTLTPATVPTPTSRITTDR